MARGGLSRVNEEDKERSPEEEGKGGREALKYKK